MQCIVMRRDREGFDYPVANQDICIGCGRCEEVCPVISRRDEKAPMAAYAARSEKYLAGSSSGGIFPALAEKTVLSGGTVYGAAFEDDMTVGHTSAADIAGLEKLRGSKYVQSDLYAVFEEVRDILKEGGKVMFTGTPCQVAGLKNYLGNDAKGLLTVDLACHGAPSPGLWKDYLAALERRLGGKIEGISFRDKSRGWRKYGFKVEYIVPDGRRSCVFRQPDDPYVALFLQDMTLRPSCYECPFRNGRSGSDITLADLWSVSDAAPVYDDDRGVSLILVNTPEGREAVDAMSEEGIRLEPVDPCIAKTRNGGFVSHIARPDNRDVFFKGRHSATDLYSYMKMHVVRKPVYAVAYETVHTFLSRIKKKMTRK